MDAETTQNGKVMSLTSVPRDRQRKKVMAVTMVEPYLPACQRRTGRREAEGEGSSQSRRSLENRGEGKPAQGLTLMRCSWSPESKKWKKAKVRPENDALMKSERVELTSPSLNALQQSSESWEARDNGWDPRPVLVTVGVGVGP